MTEKQKLIRKHTVATQFLDKLSDGSISVDLGNHFKGKKDFDDNTYHILLSLTDFTDAQLKELGECLYDPNSRPLKNPIKLSESCYFSCHECGKHLSFETNGKSLRCTNPCPYPDGYPIIEFELNIPSGKMVVGNDFRSNFQVIGDYYINYVSEIAKTTLKYAEVGMAHAFVGNTCPSIYKLNNKKFVVGTKSSKGNNPVKNSKRVGSICTDLWWYSIVDYDEFERRYGCKAEKHDNVDIVHCQPGVYKFRHQYHKLDHDDYENSQIYTFIDFARKPDPIVDYKANFCKLNFTAGQIIYDSIARYPSLYRPNLDKVDSMESIQRAADHIMATNGNGIDWHPNGWGSDNPDLNANSPSVEIPIFNRKFKWYPISKGFCTLCNAAGLFVKGYGRQSKIYLNQSFTELAFNILHCMCKYGVDCSNSQMTRKQEIQQIKSIQKLAQLTLVKLAKIYPDRVPVYCKRFLDKLTSKNSKKST